MLLMQLGDSHPQLTFTQVIRIPEPCDCSKLRSRETRETMEVKPIYCDTNRVNRQLRQQSVFFSSIMTYVEQTNVDRMTRALKAPTLPIACTTELLSEIIIDKFKQLIKFAAKIEVNKDNHSCLQWKASYLYRLSGMTTTPRSIGMVT